MSQTGSSNPRIGYLCAYVPEEIIHAAGFSPVRIAPSAMPPVRADAHLQSYTCCLARSCLDQALVGKLDGLAGVVFAHTCDTLQGLADIWREAFPTRFVETVVGPVALNSPYAQEYLTAELRRFTAALEKYFGVRVTDDALRVSVRLYNARHPQRKSSAQSITRSQGASRRSRVVSAAHRRLRWSAALRAIAVS